MCMGGGWFAYFSVPQAMENPWKLRFFPRFFRSPVARGLLPLRKMEKLRVSSMWSPPNIPVTQWCFFLRKRYGSLQTNKTLHFFTSILQKDGSLFWWMINLSFPTKMSDNFPHRLSPLFFLILALICQPIMTGQPTPALTYPFHETSWP